MDPYLEDQEWPDFHHAAIEVIRELLTSNVGTHYIVRVERRVYLEHQTDEREPFYVADATVLEKGVAAGSSPSASAEATIAPVECILPMPEEKREAFLYIRERKTMDVVTVLEVLSPGNKRPGSDGRSQYLDKREAVLKSQSHLVEIDLLRGGARLPTVGSLPPGDYYAIVSRRRKRPRAQVYPWTLRDRMPTILVPLKEEDPDVSLDVQAVLDTVYDRARYDLSIDYRAPLSPPLNDADADWERQVLEAVQHDEENLE